MEASSSMEDLSVNETVFYPSNQSLGPTSDLLFSIRRRQFENQQDTGNPFDQPTIKALLFGLYSVVFILSFFGNLAVVLVTTLHWRMRKTATFCLFNLAIANLCVGMFCVYQNLSLFLIESWIFGDLMCKMYFFIMSLSHTASILILVVIAIERYVVIVHPLRGRRLITVGKLQKIIIVVWILSGVISSHRFYSVSTSENSLPGGGVEIICSPNVLLHNHKAVDLANFLLLFLLPLFVISILYTRVSLYLKRHSLRFRTVSVTPRSITGSTSDKKTLERLLRNLTPVEVSSKRREKRRRAMEKDVKTIGLKFFIRRNTMQCRTNNNSSPGIHCFRRARTFTDLLGPTASHKAVTRMLIVIVTTFALCNFPFHLRKMCQNYCAPCYLDHPLFELATPATFLTMYAHCAMNPFIYAFMHRRFRVCLVELLFRGCRRVKRRHVLV